MPKDKTRISDGLIPWGRINSPPQQNRDAIRAQFSNLTKNCKACHDEYRIQ